MSILEPYLGALKAFSLVAIGLALFGAGHHFGAQGVQADWNNERADRKEAENRVVFERLRNNERMAEQQDLNNRKITEKHNAELAQVRADIARSPGLRVGPGICAGFAAGTQTKGSSRGDGADPGAGLVREDVRRDLNALKIRVEEALAAGRACQKFASVAGNVQ